MKRQRQPNIASAQERWTDAFAVQGESIGETKSQTTTTSIGSNRPMSTESRAVNKRESFAAKLQTDFWKAIVEGDKVNSERTSPQLSQHYPSNRNTTGSSTPLKQCSLIKMALSANRLQNDDENAAATDGNDNFNVNDGEKDEDHSTESEGTERWIVEMAAAHMLQDTIHDILYDSSHCGEISYDDRTFLQAWGAKVNSEQDNHNQEVLDALQTYAEVQAVAKKEHAMNKSLRMLQSQASRNRKLEQELEDNLDALQRRNVRLSSINRLLGGIDALRPTGNRRLQRKETEKADCHAYLQSESKHR